MTPQDKQAALAAIERTPERYEVIRHLPDDLRALLEPEERLHRYANVAAVLIGEAGTHTRRQLHDGSTTEGQIALSLILNAALSAVQALERRRAEAEGAAETLRRQREAWVEDDTARMQKFDALTGDRTIAEVLESERELREEVARLRCQLVGEARV